MKTTLGDRHPRASAVIGRPEWLRDLVLFLGQANRALALACAQEGSHRPRANQCGWLGASKDMVFVGAPLASLPDTMTTRTRSRGVTPGLSLGKGGGQHLVLRLRRPLVRCRLVA
jgi:hypothetical protein